MGNSFFGSTVLLSRVRSIANLEDPSHVNLNKEARETSKLTSVQFLGRIVCWILTAGYIERNPDLNIATKKIIAIARQALSVPECLSMDEYQTVVKALRNLKQIDASQHGNQSRELEKVIQFAAQHERFREAAAEGVSVCEELRQQFLQRLANRDHSLLEHYALYDEQTGYYSHIDIDKLRRDIANLYPGVRLYCDKGEDSLSSKNVSSERRRIENAMLVAVLIQMGTSGAYNYLQSHQHKDQILLESLKEMTAYFIKNYSTPDSLHELFTTIEMHGLGKVEYIAKLANSDLVGAEAANESQRQILLRFLNSAYSFLLRTYSSLTNSAQDVIKTIWQTECSIISFINGENVPGSLIETIKFYKSNPKAYQLLKDSELFSLVATKNQPEVALTNRIFMPWRYHLDLLMDTNQLKQDYNEEYIKQLANELYRSYLNSLISDLSLSSSEDYALIRLCWMNQTFDIETAKLIKQAFTSLKVQNKATYNSLIEELNKDGMNSKDPAIVIDGASNLIQAYMGLATSEKKMDEIDRSLDEKNQMMVQGLKTLAAIYAFERHRILSMPALPDKVPAIVKVYAKELVDQIAKFSFEEVLKLNRVIINSRNQRAAFALSWSSRLTSLFWSLVRK